MENYIKTYEFEYSFGEIDFTLTVDKSDIISAMCEFLKSRCIDKKKYRKKLKSEDTELLYRAIDDLYDNDFIDLDGWVDSNYEYLHEYFTDKAYEEYEDLEELEEHDRRYGIV